MFQLSDKELKALSKEKLNSYYNELKDEQNWFLSEPLDNDGNPFKDYADYLARSKYADPNETPEDMYYKVIEFHTYLKKVKSIVGKK